MVRVTDRELAWRTWSARIFAGVLLTAGVLLLVAASAWSAILWPARPPLTPEVITALRPAAFVLSAWLLLSTGWSLRAALAGKLQAWYGLAACGAVGYSLAMWLVLPVLDTAISYRYAAAWLVNTDVRL